MTLVTIPMSRVTFGVALALIGVPEISDGEPDTRSGGSRPTSRGFRRSSAHALAPIGRQGRGRPAKERTPWLFDERTLRRILAKVLKSQCRVAR